MRRNVFSVLRRFVKFMFTSSISKMITGLANEYGKDEKTASFLRWIKDIVWPKDEAKAQRELQDFSKFPMPTQKEMDDRQQLLREELLKAIPVSLATILGHHTCEEAAVTTFPLAIFRRPLSCLLVLSVLLTACTSST